MRAAVIALGLLAAAGTAAAQEARPAPADAGQALRQAVLTVDQEALYIESAWGRRAQVELARMSQQVSADNDRIFAELSAAEEELTQARATLSPEEFRARASAFDERVTQVRRERDAAARAIGQAAERDRALFFQAAVPFMGTLMTERGALVVLDQRTVLFSDDRIDMTQALIARLDAELGDGAQIIRGTAAGPEPAGGEAQDGLRGISPDPAPAGQPPAAGEPGADAARPETGNTPAPEPLGAPAPAAAPPAADGLAPDDGKG